MTLTKRRLRILDLFAGTGSSTLAFEVAGDDVLKVELDPQHGTEWVRDVTTINPVEVIDRLGARPDFIWASPPCQAFSVAAIGRHWTRGGADPQPKHPNAIAAQAVVAATLTLIHYLEPTYWLMENPRGMLRKLALMKGFRRWTVTYCSYGDTRQKPTDLWGVMPAGWHPRPMCQPGATCHIAAPRGSRTGTQGLDNKVDRSRVPYELSLEVSTAVHNGGRAHPPVPTAPTLELPL